MATDNKPRTQEEIEKELSVGNFAGQQARTMGFQLGGLAAGLGLGFLANRMGAGKWVGKKIGGVATREAEHLGEQLGGIVERIAENTGRAEKLGKYIVNVTGAVVGMIGGGMASLYEHWVKVERERLNIQEANRDIASIMEKRVEFEDTLKSQHELVKTMLKKHEELEKSGSFASKEATRREERATTERQPG